MNEQTTRPTTGRAFLALLGVSAMLAPMAMNMHVPVLSYVADGLGVPLDAAGLTVTVYLWVFGVSMLFVGVPADRFGRRRTLLAGLGLFVVGAVGAALSSELVVVVGFRAVQALGAAAAIVLPRTMVNDVEQGPRALQLLGILGTMQAVAPSISPLIGTALAPLAGWASIWWFQGAVGLGLALACLRALPETRGAVAPAAGAGPPLAPHPWPLVAGAAGAMGLTTAMYFVFLASGATAMQVRFAVPETALGVLLAYMSGMFVVGNVLTAKLGGRVPLPLLPVVGAGAVVTGCLLILTGAVGGLVPVIVGLGLYAVGNGLVMPSALAIAGGVPAARRARVMSLVSAAPFILGGTLASGTTALRWTSWEHFTALVLVGNVMSLVVAALGARAARPEEPGAGTTNDGASTAAPA